MRSDKRYDYEAERRRISWTSKIVTLVMFLFLFISDFVYTYCEKTFTFLDVLDFTFWGFREICVIIIPSLTYTTFLYDLQKRFKVLNDVLRYFKIKLSVAIFLIYLHLNGRKRLRGVGGSTVIVCIPDSIRSVKFIGRQHSHLTEILDIFNSIYAFQVKQFLYFLNMKSLTFLILIMLDLFVLLQ